jgi:hypothetical protein
MEEAYNAVNNWNSTTGDTTDMLKKTFQAQTASKGVDASVTKDIMAAAAETEKGMMEKNADLALRNTTGIMEKEHGYNLEATRVGREESEKYERTRGEVEREGIKETGNQNVRGIEATGGEQRKGIETTGEQSRKTIEKEGEVARQNLAFDRANAYMLARQGAKR